MSARDGQATEKNKTIASRFLADRPDHPCSARPGLAAVSAATRVRDYGARSGEADSQVRRSGHQIGAGRPPGSVASGEGIGAVRRLRIMADGAALLTNHLYVIYIYAYGS